MLVRAFTWHCFLVFMTIDNVGSKRGGLKTKKAGDAAVLASAIEVARDRGWHRYRGIPVNGTVKQQQRGPQSDISGVSSGDVLHRLEHQSRQPRRAEGSPGSLPQPASIPTVPHAFAEAQRLQRRIQQEEQALRQVQIRQQHAEVARQRENERRAHERASVKPRNKMLHELEELRVHHLERLHHLEVHPGVRHSVWESPRLSGPNGYIKSSRVGHHVPHTFFRSKAGNQREHAHHVTNTADRFHPSWISTRPSKAPTTVSKVPTTTHALPPTSSAVPTTSHKVTTTTPAIQTTISTTVEPTTTSPRPIIQKEPINQRPLSNRDRMMNDRMEYQGFRSRYQHQTPNRALTNRVVSGRNQGGSSIVHTRASHDQLIRGGETPIPLKSGSSEWRLGGHDFGGAQSEGGDDLHEIPSRKETDRLPTPSDELAGNTREQALESHYGNGMESAANRDDQRLVDSYEYSDFQSRSVDAGASEFQEVRSQMTRPAIKPESESDLLELKPRHRVGADFLSEASSDVWGEPYERQNQEGMGIGSVLSSVDESARRLPPDDEEGGSSSYEVVTMKVPRRDPIRGNRDESPGVDDDTFNPLRVMRDAREMNLQLADQPRRSISDLGSADYSILSISFVGSDSYSLLQPGANTATDGQQIDSDPVAQVHQDVVARVADWTEWGEWGEWTHCSQSCGHGTKSRSRSCIGPAAGSTMSTCPGERTEKVTCALERCTEVSFQITADRNTLPPSSSSSSLSGGGQWTEWSECSMTCGAGRQYRVRSCDQPRDDLGELLCTGRLEHSRLCNQGKCEKGSDESRLSQVIEPHGYGYGHGHIHTKRIKCHLDASRSRLPVELFWTTPTGEKITHAMAQQSSKYSIDGDSLLVFEDEPNEGSYHCIVVYGGGDGSRIEGRNVAHGPCLSNPCHRHGTCMETPTRNGTSYTCLCTAGYEGLRCHMAPYLEGDIIVLSLLGWFLVSFVILFLIVFFCCSKQYKKRKMKRQLELDDAPAEKLLAKIVPLIDTVHDTETEDADMVNETDGLLPGKSRVRFKPDAEKLRGKSKHDRDRKPNKIVGPRRKSSRDGNPPITGSKTRGGSIEPGKKKGADMVTGDVKQEEVKQEEVKQEEQRNRNNSNTLDSIGYGSDVSGTSHVLRFARNNTQVPGQGTRAGRTSWTVGNADFSQASSDGFRGNVNNLNNCALSALDNSTISIVASEIDSTSVVGNDDESLLEISTEDFHDFQVATSFSVFKGSPAKHEGLAVVEPNHDMVDDWEVQSRAAYYRSSSTGCFTDCATCIPQDVRAPGSGFGSPKRPKCVANDDETPGHISFSSPGRSDLLPTLMTPPRTFGFNRHVSLPPSPSPSLCPTRVEIPRLPQDPRRLLTHAEETGILDRYRQRRAEHLKSASAFDKYEQKIRSLGCPLPDEGCAPRNDGTYRSPDSRTFPMDGYSQNLAGLGRGDASMERLENETYQSTDAGTQSGARTL